MVAVDMARFVNPIPNDARYKKYNAMTLDVLCEAAYHGDTELLEKLLRTGDEDRIFNGDVNMHLTDVNALHMAAMAGQEASVKLLLEAKADPHVRCVMPEGKDPKTGDTARDKATRFKHASIVALLQEAEKSYPLGWYQQDGIANNRKLYAEPKATPAAAPPAREESVPTGPPLPLALLFPGQGSQYVKMLDGVKDLPEVKDMLTKAKSILGYDLLELCLQGPEDKLAETKYCQPAMFVGGLAGVSKLRSQRAEAVERPKCVAGLSLGEYTALCAAGVLSFEDGLRLVKLRGEAMQEAAQVGKQAMLSVAGLEQAVLEQCCKDAEKKAGSGAVCRIANALFPKGFSCAGTESAVNELKAIAEKKGALQAKLLKTGGAFHTSLMQPAQERLQKALEEVFPSMKSPRCAIYMNVTGEPLAPGSDPKVILDLLKKQLVSPVLWSVSVEKMIKDGVTEFYECGPQKQLKAMMKRIDNKVWNKTTSMEV
eukprot:TRINITY_DN109439_c0_g1_i1.p1 TRINITY_DN109439_c0_g1~~TRINITY_DN109439_c0_g1_i1.p1  ORF type:complete len:484 (+),score=126.95 TRINITY_DN109439_c0_g1_i1:64-1515(+)